MTFRELFLPLADAEQDTLVYSRLNSVQDQDRSTLDHIPFVEGQIIYVFGDEGIFRDANCGEHGLFPEAGTSLDSCESIYEDQDQNTLHWSRDQAESERLGVVFVPGLNIKGKEC